MLVPWTRCDELLHGLKQYMRRKYLNSFKAIFQWYTMPWTTSLPSIILNLLVEAIAKSKYLSPLAWKRGEVDKNKPSLTSTNCLVLFIDVFISWFPLRQIHTFTSDMDNWEEMIKDRKFSFCFSKKMYTCFLFQYKIPSLEIAYLLTYCLP